MAEQTDQRGNGNIHNNRKYRIALGGASVPLSIVISYLVHQKYGPHISDEFMIALTSIISSLISVMSICFWDIRGMLLERFQRRRRTK